MRPGFDGGQTAMARRLPKRGFNNRFRKEVFAVNLGDVGVRFQAEKATVDVQALKDIGFAGHVTMETGFVSRAFNPDEVARRGLAHLKSVEATLI